MGTALAGQGNHAGAEECYQQAVLIETDNAGYWANLAMVQFKQGKLDAANATAYEARSRDFSHPHVLNVSALVEVAQGGSYGIAEDYYRDAIDLAPDVHDFRKNYAYLLQLLGRYPEAEAQYREIVQANPMDYDARVQRAMTLMTLGQWEEGLSEYDLRHVIHPSPCPPGIPLLHRGNLADAKGKRVLVCCEQGLGDSVMMLERVMALQDVLRDGGNSGAVEILARPGVEYGILRRLCDYQIYIYDRLVDCIHFDFAVPMMSLLRLTGIPECERYAYAPSNLNGAPPTSDVLVGFCWQGSRLHQNDAYRSVAPEVILPLVDMPGIVPVNLQHEEPSFGRMKNWRVDGFRELHRVISNCKIVVTVDTAIAHIAGAMGVPTMLMLPSNPDWRWGVAPSIHKARKERTVWYDSMRIFRARAPKQWGPVVEQVKAEIERLMAA